MFEPPALLQYTAVTNTQPTTMPRDTTSLCPIEPIPPLGVFPRQAKSSSSLRQWLSRERRTLGPQEGRCLITEERYPEAAIQFTRLVPSDTQHRDVRSILHASSTQILIAFPSSMQVTCLEWSWGLPPLALDIDSPSNLLIRKLVYHVCHLAFTSL